MGTGHHWFDQFSGSRNLGRFYSMGASRTVMKIGSRSIHRRGPGGPANVRRSSFGLRIIRGTETGAASEGTMTYLSESEREIIGFVFAVAGQLVHEVLREPCAVPCRCATGGCADDRDWPHMDYENLC